MGENEQQPLNPHRGPNGANAPRHLPVSLPVLLKRFYFRILFTWLLVISEAILWLVFPLMMGWAIDDYIAGNYQGLFYFGLIGVLSLIVGAGRRFYDTRAYSRIYSTITPEMVAQEQDREASISSISARANMLTEFVEFLENSFPEMINSLIGLVGTFFIIYFLNFQVFIACLIATVVIILLYALTSDRIYRYNQGFNDSLEHQVAVLTENDPPSIKKHFQGLMRWNIRLSDLETINFSVSWVFLFGVLIFSIIAVVENGAPSQGKVLAVLMYVFNYIESVIAIPLFYQQYVRLKEISHRLE